MPTIIWVIVRIARAFAATARLVFDIKLMRSLPWSYLRTLPLKDPWVGVLVVGIALGMLAIPLTILLPLDAANVSYQIGLWPVVAAIVTTWVRAWRQRRRLRGKEPKGRTEFV
jgi:hypothetical protein